MSTNGSITPGSPLAAAAAQGAPPPPPAARVGDLSRPFLLAQISDLHLGERPRDGSDPEGCLRAVVKALRRLPDRPDAILVSGALAEHAKPKEYRGAAKAIGKLGIPIHVLPGNHDDRATMREVLGAPGDGDAPPDHAVDLGPLQLVVVDSTIPGEDRGGFGPGQLERLPPAVAPRGKPPPPPQPPPPR